MSSNVNNAGAILDAMKRSQTLADEIQLVTTYFEASRTEWETIARNRYYWWRLWWMWKYRWLALRHADRAYSYIENGEAPTYDQIDVLCTVWRRLAQTDEVCQIRAKKILSEMGVPTPNNITIHAHTAAFIIMHRLWYEIDVMTPNTERIIAGLGHTCSELASYIVYADARQTAYKQASRVYARLATYLSSKNPRKRDYLRLSREMARLGNVSDQLLKQNSTKKEG